MLPPSKINHLVRVNIHEIFPGERIREKGVNAREERLLPFSRMVIKKKEQAVVHTLFPRVFIYIYIHMEKASALFLRGIV